MAGDDMFLDEELSSALGRMAYSPYSSDGAAHFGNDTTDALAGGVGSDVGSFDAGIDPASFFVPQGAQAADAAGYGDAGVIMAAEQPRQQTAAANAGEEPPLRTSWTPEEDEVLREAMTAFGDHKPNWTAIAHNLPGRIGKQCRERWMNHLRPGIDKKEMWKDEEEHLLIGLHRSFGNRWTIIAQCLSGRSENAVKNHWNATRRSLTSVRRTNKKKAQQAAPRRLSELEEYILQTLDNTSGASAAAPPSSLPVHPNSSHGNDGMIGASDAAVQHCGYNPYDGMAGHSDAAVQVQPAVGYNPDVADGTAMYSWPGQDYLYPVADAGSNSRVVLSWHCSLTVDDITVHSLWYTGVGRYQGGPWTTVPPSWLRHCLYPFAPSFASSGAEQVYQQPILQPDASQFGGQSSNQQGDAAPAPYLASTMEHGLHGYYYNGAGSSSGAGTATEDPDDVVEMALRQFSTEYPDGQGYF